MNFLPIATMEPVELEEANKLLVRWNHKMGALARPNAYVKCHALLYEGHPVAVATTSTLIRPNAGGLEWLNRESSVELSRLCAERSGLCRVMLRLWREFVFPSLGVKYAVSYQDADLHSGNTYRFDGWERVAFSRSGIDTRSGRKGRRKWIWVWRLPLEGN